MTKLWSPVLVRAQSVMRKEDINRIITKRASANRHPCCIVKDRVRCNRGTHQRRGISAGFLEKMTLELTPEEIVHWGSKEKETPDLKALMQKSAWCVLGKERRDGKCRGKKSEMTQGRLRMGQAGPSGLFSYDNEYASLPEDQREAVGGGMGTGMTRSVLLKRPPWLLCRK